MTTTFTQAFNHEVQLRLAARTADLEKEVRQELTRELLAQVTPAAVANGKTEVVKTPVRRAFRKRRVQSRRRNHSGRLGDVFNFIKRVGRNVTSASIAEQFNLDQNQASATLATLFKIHKKVLQRTDQRPFVYTYSGS